MYNSKERLEYIIDYLANYEAKIKLANSVGLYDEAVIFESFAEEVCDLYFGIKFTNLNKGKSNYPYVDLRSDDGKVFVQVSTEKDVPNKIKSTLKKIKLSNDEEIKQIKRVCFFVLSNDSISKLRDYKEENKIGDIEFIGSRDLITFITILEKAKTNIDFQNQLYQLLFNDGIYNKISSFNKAVENSKEEIGEIQCLINDEYYIDRTALLDNIEANNDKYITIFGEAGAGKTVLAKKLLENKDCVLFARAEKIVQVSSINDIWDIDLKTFFEYRNDKDTFIFIDSLEFIADNKEKLKVLRKLYELSQNYSQVKIVTTCRTNDIQAFVQILGMFNVQQYEVPCMNIVDCRGMIEKYPVLNNIITITEYQGLIRIPFYINLIVSNLPDLKEIKDESQLRGIIWHKIICKNNNKMQNIVKDIAFTRAKDFSVGVNDEEYDSQIIDILVRDNILIRNDNTVRFKYDIYEDICFEQYIDLEFDRCKGKYTEFFNNIEKWGRSIYRRYQIWIGNKLLSKSNRNKFLYKLVEEDDLPQKWKDQTYIGLVKAVYCEEFFNEYSTAIIDSNKIYDFIRVVNLYAYSISPMSSVTRLISLVPCGSGRKCIINLMKQNNWYQTQENSYRAILKVCTDYTMMQGIDNQTSHYVCDILKHLLKLYYEQVEKYGLFNYESELDNIMSSIYRLAKYEKKLILNIWNNLRLLYLSKDEYQIKFASHLIKHALQWQHVSLSQYMSKELCSLAEMYWTFNPYKKEEQWGGVYSEFNFTGQFGLSEAAEDYESESFGKLVMQCNFYRSLFQFDFFNGLEWVIGFVNKIIDYIDKNNKEGTLPKYSLYFVDNNATKEYSGYAELWYANKVERVMPLIVSDLLYIMKDAIRNKINEFNTINECNAFCDKVKNIIYHKSNNIVLLSIIADIGMEFSDKLPGYAIDLISNIDLVMCDTSRYVYTKYSLSKRYDNSAINEICLREYVLMQSLQYPELSDKIFLILDYLYDKYPESLENGNERIQIQIMDKRRSNVYTYNNEAILIEQQLDGIAKEIVDNNAVLNANENQVGTMIGENIKKIDNAELSTRECENIIEQLMSLIPRCKVPQVYQNQLISFMSYALSKDDLSKENRQNYTTYWLDGLSALMHGESFYFDIDKIIILFSQIEEDIDVSLKNSIKKVMIDAIMNQEVYPGVSQIASEAIIYIRSNPRLSRAMFNTFLMLAEDEMKHQKYNAEYLKSYPHGNKNFKFVPNMQSKLKGVDTYIIEDGNNVYEDNKSAIIEKYLYDESVLNIDSFNMHDYDISLISYALNCGLSLNDEMFKDIVRECLVTLVKIYNDKGNSYGYINIINIYQESSIRWMLQQAILSNEEEYKIVLEIMFKNICFDEFSRKSIEFYQEVFGIFLSTYFDAYNNQIIRQYVEKKILLLEEYINNIDANSIKLQLYKILILAPTRYNGGGDWSRCKTEYKYRDKMFLNKMFSKYGGYNLEDLLLTVHKMHIDKLLPEVILSINETFNKVISDKGRSAFWNIINRQNDIVKLIISEVYFNNAIYSKIKEDDDMINAYEGVLKNLIGVRYPEAAVLLDEFRVH